MNEIYVLKYIIKTCGDYESPEIIIGVSKEVLEKSVKDFNIANEDCDRSIDDDYYSIEVVDLESLPKYKTVRLF